MMREHARSTAAAFTPTGRPMGGEQIGNGDTLLVDGTRKQVIGVTPPDFFGLSVGDRFDIALPLCRPKELHRDVFDIAVMGRLRPGLSLKQVSAVAGVQSRDFREPRHLPKEARNRFGTVPNNSGLAAFPASAGIRVACASSMIHRCGCCLPLRVWCCSLRVRITNLLLARASTRDREIAVRLALGASRNRLLGQLFAEGALLAGRRRYGHRPRPGPQSTSCVGAFDGRQRSRSALSTDWRVLLFTAAVATLTCIVFGVMPAQRALGADR